MKIGIFGGTFDPVHNGHVHLVQQFIKALKLDKVIVVVANLSPFKIERQPHASADRRLEMVKEAFEGEELVEISSLEIDRGGSSYTIDTVSAMIEAYGKEELILLLTQDTFQGFDSWKDSKEIDSKIKIVVAVDEKKETKGICREICPIPWFNCSSTLIREKQSKGEGCKEFLSPKVLDYIAKHQLYSRAYDNG